MMKGISAAKKMALLVAVGAILGGLSCTWSDADTEEFYSMLMIGTILGALFGIVCVVLGALPLCCGIMKPQAKIVAGIIIGIGIFICFIPAITGAAQGSAAVDKMCDRCKESTNRYDSDCSDKDKEEAKEAISALGVIVAYIHAFGFVVVILGITAATFGCCILCKCCKMKEEVAGGGGVQGQVVGQAVGQPC